MDCNSTRYFRNLQTDLEKLGVGGYGQDITSTGKLADELECTTNISYKCNRPNLDLQTNIGQIILDWSSRIADFMFNPNINGVGVCLEAEPKFLANIDSAEHEQLKSPIIILNKDEPIALAKAYGEPTIYSFITKPEIGLFQDTICINREISLGARNLPIKSGAYLLKLSDISVPFEPIRLSTFWVPEAYREQLNDEDDYWKTLNLPLGISNDALLRSSQEAIYKNNSDLISIDEIHLVN